MVDQPAGRVNEHRYNDTLDAWRAQVGRDLGRESVDAYEYFLETLFFYYGESMRAFEKGTKEG
jgi:translation initiation factor 2 alpha subunit (eIF-2alpha)